MKKSLMNHQTLFLIQVPCLSASIYILESFTWLWFDWLDKLIFHKVCWFLGVLACNCKLCWKLFIVDKMNSSWFTSPSSIACFTSWIYYFDVQSLLTRGRYLDFSSHSHLGLQVSWPSGWKCWVKAQFHEAISRQTAWWKSNFFFFS